MGTPPPGNLGTGDGYGKLAREEPIPLGNSGKSVTFAESELTVEKLTGDSSPDIGKVSFTCTDGSRNPPKTFHFRIGKDTPLFKQIQTLHTQSEFDQNVAIKALTLKYIATLLKVKEAVDPAIKNVSARFEGGAGESVTASVMAGGVDLRDETVAEIGNFKDGTRNISKQFEHLASAKKVNKTVIKAINKQLTVDLEKVVDPRREQEYSQRIAKFKAHVAGMAEGDLPTNRKGETLAGVSGLEAKLQEKATTRAEAEAIIDTRTIDQRAVGVSGSDAPLTVESARQTGATAPLQSAHLSPSNPEAESLQQTDNHLLHEDTGLEGEGVSSEAFMSGIKAELADKIAEAVAAGVEKSDIDTVFDYDISPPSPLEHEPTSSYQAKLESFGNNVKSEITSVLKLLIATKKENPAIAEGRLQNFRESVITELRDRFSDEIMQTDFVEDLVTNQFKPEAKSIPDDLTTQGTLKDGFLSILGAAIEGFVIEDAEKSRRHSEAELSEIRSSIQEGFAAMIPSGEKGGEVQRIINDNLPKDIGSMPVDESGKRQFESRITEHITRCIQTLLKDSEVPAHETVTEIVDAIRADLSVAVDEARTIGVEADKIEQLLKSYLNFSEAEIPEQAGLESFKLIKKIEIEGWLDTFKVTHRIDLKSQAVDQMDLLKANVTEKNRDHIGELRDQGVEEGNYMPLLQILFPRVPDKPFTEADMEFLVDQIPKTFRELTQQFIPAVAVVGVSYVESEGVLKQGLKDTMTKMYRKRFSQLSFKPYSFDNNTRRVPDDAKTRPFEFMNQFCDDYVRACFEAEGFTTPEANFLIELNKKAISSLAVPDGIDLAVLRGKLADKESLLYMRNIPQSQEPTPFETEFTEKFKREIVDVMDRGETVSQRTLEEFQQLVLKRQPGLEVNYGNIANQVGVDTTVRTIFARTLPYNVLPCSASTSDYNIRVGNLDSYIPGEVMVGEQKLLTYTDRRGEEYVFMGASALHGGHYHHHSIVGNDLKEDLQSGMGGQRMRDLTTSNLRNVLSRGRELDIVLVKKDVVEKVLAEKPDFFTSFNRDSSTEWFGNNCWFVQGIQRGYMMYKMNEALGSSDA